MSRAILQDTTVLVQAFESKFMSLGDLLHMNNSCDKPPLGNVSIFGRLHLYGDVYSSPGVSLRQKQLLMCAFLGEANMPEQLFGHLLAVRKTSLLSEVFVLVA